jgi:hypothetical protein
VTALFLAPQAGAASQIEAPPLDRLQAPQGAAAAGARSIEKLSSPKKFSGVKKSALPWMKWFARKCAFREISPMVASGDHRAG